MINIDRIEAEDEGGVTLEKGSTDGAAIERDTSTRRKETSTGAGEILTKEEAENTGGRTGDGTGDDRLQWRDQRAAEDLHVVEYMAEEGLNT